MWSDGFQRYNTPISKIFSVENKLKIQMRIESVLAEVQEELGMIPQGIADAIREASSRVTSERVSEIEREIHHDLMAMVKALAEQAGDAGEYIHNTATSMDIQDTVLALQMTEAKRVLLETGSELLEVLKNIARKYRNQPILGRTHGQFAVPTTVGFKFANFLFEMHYALENLSHAPTELSKFSGAVGNYASSHRLDIERMVLDKLGLKPVLISTQVITRLVHSEFMFGLTQVSAVIERISKEIRHLQRSEIGEFFEPRSNKQVGSSAMPHKRNPHKSERLNGLARMLRANISVSFENIALEHERDLTNSAVERLSIPSSVVILHYMMLQAISLLSNLEVNVENINRNLNRASASKSEQILLLLIDKIGRQAGHELLRKHVGAENFREAVMEDPEILKYIDRKSLEEVFDRIDIGLSPEKVDEVIRYVESHPL